MIASKSPSTIRLGLDALRDTDELHHGGEAPDPVASGSGVVLATDDAREGLMAFLERRTPQWTGNSR